MIGRMPALGALTLNGFRGCTGVAKDGDDEGNAEDGMAALLRLNIGAGVLCILTRFRANGLYSITRRKDWTKELVGL